MLVGDDGVGKTSICAYYKDGKSPSTSLPIILPNFAKKETYMGQKAILVLWDSACNEDYNEIRPIGYKNANFFFLCFALNNKKSLENAENIWLKEISPFTKEAKVILIGTKRDIQTLTDSQISSFRYRINPYLYVECSTRSGENIQQIFDNVVKLTIEPNSIPKQMFEDPNKPNIILNNSNENADKKETEGITKHKSTTCLLI